MQYITQCSYKLHKSNYLLSRLLKNSRSHSGRPKRINTKLVCTHHQDLVEPIGIEPMTSCLQSRRSPS